MTESFRIRRLIALFAAYLVAIQGALLPLTVVTFAVPETALCSSARDADRQPTGHTGECPCAAGCGTQCCTPALAPPPRADAIADGRVAEIITPFSFRRGASHAMRVGSHRPRGPPHVSAA